MSCYALQTEHPLDNKLKDFFINLDPEAEDINILLQLNDNHFEIKKCKIINHCIDLKNVTSPSHHKNFLPQNFILKDILFYNKFFIMSGLFNADEDQEKGGLLVYNAQKSLLIAQDVHDFKIDHMWLIDGQLFLKTVSEKSSQGQLFITDIEQFLRSKSDEL